ncbi:MAG TPA: hypothetical protein V6C57_08535 [Coleofasciculaceae cyanobacterium]
MERILSTQIIDRLLDSITAPLRDWLNAHPAGYWLVSHPLWSVGLLLISLLLLSGLLGAIAQLTQKLWIGILQAPWTLTRWIFTTVFHLLKSLLRWQGSVEPEPNRHQERLTEILTRLEVLKQEQDELLQEVKAILAVKEMG